MSKYVNIITQDKETFNIHDERIPEVTNEDAGKVVKVSDAGVYELGESSGGGSDLPIYVFDGFIGYGGEKHATIQDLLDAIEDVEENKLYTIFLTNVENSGILNYGIATFSFYSESYMPAPNTHYTIGQWMGTYYKELKATALANTEIKDMTSTYHYTTSQNIPSTSSLDSSKTYALKCANGAVEWSENLSVTVTPKITKVDWAYIKAHPTEFSIEYDSNFGELAVTQLGYHNMFISINKNEDVLIDYPNMSSFRLRINGALSTVHDTNDLYGMAKLLYYDVGGIEDTPMADFGFDVEGLNVYTLNGMILPVFSKD